MPSRLALAQDCFARMGPEERREFLAFAAGLSERAPPEVLPLFALEAIITYLSASTVSTFCAVSKPWSTVANKRSVWEALCRREHEIVLRGGMRDLVEVVDWRRLAQVLHAHRAPGVDEPADDPVARFIERIGYAQPEAGRVFTFHAPEATPIYYQHWPAPPDDGAGGGHVSCVTTAPPQHTWRWSADRVNWMPTTTTSAAGGVFAQMNAQLVDQVGVSKPSMPCSAVVTPPSLRRHLTPATCCSPLAGLASMPLLPLPRGASERANSDGAADPQPAPVRPLRSHGRHPLLHAAGAARRGGGG
jgi:hypothetical protein